MTDHKAMFDEVARQVMAAAIDFSKGVGPTLSVFDIGRMFLGAGAMLIGQALDSAGVARLLRELADSIDRPGDRAKLN